MYSTLPRLVYAVASQSCTFKRRLCRSVTETLRDVTTIGRVLSCKDLYSYPHCNRCVSMIGLGGSKRGTNKVCTIMHDL